MMTTAAAAAARATTSFADLPDTIFFKILTHLDWYEILRVDNTLLNRNARNRYLDALKIIKLNVARSKFYKKALDKGILNWLISRNIRVISWDLEVNNTQLMTIANGLPQLKSLNIVPFHLGDILLTKE